MKDRQPILVLDVDQTLAGGVVETHMTIYNQRLGLGMTGEEIVGTGSYAKTFDVPQIQQHRAQGKEAESLFQRVRAELRTSYEAHLAFNELPGSVEGVKQLTGEFVFGGYYSVRPREVELATREWLLMRGFPDSENMVICESHQDKLQKIINDHLINNPERTVVLVDDSLKNLAEAAKNMVGENPAVKQHLERLVLVGFGQTESETAEIEGSFYPDTGIRTIALPSWETQDVESMKAKLLPA